MRRQLSVLCFGDSLTKGCWCGAPYGTLMGRVWAGPVATAGYPGNTAGRLVQDMQRYIAADPGRRYDACVVLAGTNDLHLRVPLDRTMAHLRTLHALAEEGFGPGCAPVAVTVPPYGPQRDDDVARERAELNGALKEDCARRGVPVVDFAAALTVLEGAAAVQMYDGDGVHLTRAGYQLLADEVAQALDALPPRAAAA